MINAISYIRENITFVSNEHQKTFNDMLIRTLRLYVEEAYPFTEDPFLPLLYVMSLPRLRKALDLAGNEVQLIALFEFKWWQQHVDKLENEGVFHLFQLAMHTYDAVFPFDYDDYIAKSIDEEDFLVLHQASLLKRKVMLGFMP